MNKIKTPIFVIIISSFFLITTCTTDNSITGNSDQTLSKPSAIPIAPFEGDDGVDIPHLILDSYHMYGPEGMCVMAINMLIGVNPTDSLNIFQNNRNIINSSYDFRDNYLSRSEKGEVYTACYYLLSKYGIENNLVNKFPKKHYELIESGVSIAYQLQHGGSNDQILIKNDFAKKLEDMLKIYRGNPNHRDIDSVLDYLEADLKKYENKPKSVIQADFK